MTTDEACGRDAGQSGGERVNPTLREIVETYLRQNGFDGLYNSWIECGCTVDDLMPCERADEVNCTAGFRVRLNDGTWGIGPRPERASENPDAKADVDMARAIGLDGC